MSLNNRNRVRPKGKEEGLGNENIDPIAAEHQNFGSDDVSSSRSSISGDEDF